MKKLIICHFSAEIIKFGLILTHLLLFLGGGQTRGKENIFEENPPPPFPRGAATVKKSNTTVFCCLK